MKKRYGILLGVVVLLLAADQWLKYWTLQNLAGAPAIDLIPGIFRLTYVENRGAAFGILQGGTVLLAIVSVLAVALLLYFYKNIPAEKGVWTMRLSYILVIAGAIGNMIDRIFCGYVVDMLEFYWFSFPVFNLEDCFIVVGGIAFLLVAMIKPAWAEALFGRSKKEDNNG